MTAEGTVFARAWHGPTARPGWDALREIFEPRPRALWALRRATDSGRGEVFRSGSCARSAGPTRARGSRSESCPVRKGPARCRAPGCLSTRRRRAVCRRGAVSWPGLTSSRYFPLPRRARPGRLAEIPTARWCRRAARGVASVWRRPAPPAHATCSSWACPRPLRQRARPARRPPSDAALAPLGDVALGVWLPMPRVRARVR